MRIHLTTHAYYSWKQRKVNESSVKGSVRKIFKYT